MAGPELWRRKSDQDVLDAVSRFHEYTDVGQAILRDEVQRRGLSFPPGFDAFFPEVGHDVRAEPVESPVAKVDAPFFEVATHKFVVMFVCTLGLYSWYRFYENWKRIHDASGRAGSARALVAIASAFLRAFFAPFWAYALFREERNAARDAGLQVRWRPWVLAMGYVVSNLLYRLPRQAAVLSLVGVLFLLPVQQEMQRVNRIRGSMGDRNSRDRAGNITCIILGVSILVVVNSSAHFLLRRNDSGGLSARYQARPQVRHRVVQRL